MQCIIPGGTARPLQQRSIRWLKPDIARLHHRASILSPQQRSANYRQYIKHCRGVLCACIQLVTNQNRQTPLSRCTRNPFLLLNKHAGFPQFSTKDKQVTTELIWIVSAELVSLLLLLLNVLGQQKVCAPQRRKPLLPSPCCGPST